QKSFSVLCRLCCTDIAAGQFTVTVTGSRPQRPSDRIPGIDSETGHYDSETPTRFQSGWNRPILRLSCMAPERGPTRHPPVARKTKAALGAGLGAREQRAAGLQERRHRVGQRVALRVADRQRQRHHAAPRDPDAARQQVEEQQLDQLGVAARLIRSASPRAFSASSACGVSTCVRPARPADIVSTLLLNVPAWRNASGRRGSNSDMMSARPPKAPKLMPPPTYLPSDIRSGRTSSVAARPCSDSREVITSSQISRAPTRSVAARRAVRNAAVAGMQPALPIIGSTITAARSVACCSISAVAAASSLYGATTQSYGTLIALPPPAKPSTPP